MKRNFKAVCILVSIIMLLSVLPVCASASFSDMAGHSGAEVINRWHKAGLVSGYPDGTFKPDANITRAEFSKIITDLFVLTGDGAEFADVSADAWYYTYVQSAADYIPCCTPDNEGNCDRLFAPEQALDMAQAVEVLSSLTKVPGDLAYTDGAATRAGLITTIDEIFGGEQGFMYRLSVIDSETAEADEILPLTVLTKDSDMATWNDAGQVLLLSWHSYPESYIPGEQFTCKYGEMWTFTDKEVLAWYDKNAEGVTDWELRFEQALGLPATDSKTHVSAFWVDMDEIIRPAYQTDATKQLTADVLDGSALGEHKEWFDGNAEYSYVTSAYPWTRLGYTYDWAEGENEFGLTEFIILANSVIDVEWTKSFDEFIAWMAEN